MNSEFSNRVLVLIGFLILLTALLWISNPRRHLASSGPRVSLLRAMWAIAFFSASFTTLSILVAMADAFPKVALLDIVALVAIGILTVSFLFRALRSPDTNQVCR